jgi:peroxiredoxin
MLLLRLLALAAILPIACAAQSPQPSPRPAAGFSIQTTAGSPIQLSAYRGKVVVLAFIITTCPHCQRTVGLLSKLQREYGSRGFQALASAVEESAAQDLPEFMERFQPAFPVGFDGRDSVLQFLQHSPDVRWFMPQMVFIDRQGMIRGHYGGTDRFLAENEENNLRGEIELLLNEPAPKMPSTRSQR